MAATAWAIFAEQNINPLTTDMVMIRQAIFFNARPLLFIAATSTAAPTAELLVTVPSCVTNAPMPFRAGRYSFVTRTCTGLDGQAVTVTSSLGGAATKTIQ